MQEYWACGDRNWFHGIFHVRVNFFYSTLCCHVLSQNHISLAIDCQNIFHCKYYLTFDTVFQKMIFLEKAKCKYGPKNLISTLWYDLHQFYILALNVILFENFWNGIFQRPMDSNRILLKQKILKIAQRGNHGILLSQPFDKNSVKSTFSVAEYINYYSYVFVTKLSWN